MALDDAPVRAPFYRRGVFWIGLVSAVVIVLGGTFAALDAHGRRHAAAINARLRAAGYGRELETLKSEPIPEEANFAATRFLSRLVEGGIKNGRWLKEHADFVRSTLVPDPGMPAPVRWDAVERRFDGYGRQQREKHLGIQAADGGATFPWTRRLLQQIDTEYGGPLTELEARFLLPQAFMPVAEVQAGEFLPYEVFWSRRSDWGCVVFLQGWSAMAIGEDRQAARATQVLWRLAEASTGSPGSQHRITDEPLTYLRGAALLTWLAAGERRWNEEEWRQVQAFCEACDPMRLARALLVVRLASIEAEEPVALEAPDYRILYLPGVTGLRASHDVTRRGHLVARLLPGGWVRATVATAKESAWKDLQSFDRDGKTWAFSPVLAAPSGWAGVSRYETGVEVAGRPHPRHIRELMMSAQALISMAGTTAALERHWLRHGSYPASLDALKPEFLDHVPLDLDGNPLRYRQDSRNGRYQLWSVGIDRVDEGGRSVPPESVGRRQRGSWPWRHDPDWLWSYP